MVHPFVAMTLNPLKDFFRETFSHLKRHTFAQLCAVLLVVYLNIDWLFKNKTSKSLATIGALPSHFPVDII